MAKIGERIDELTKQYCDIYDEYKELPGFDARNVALADLNVERHIWDKVYHNVKRYIKGQEKD